MNNNITKRKLTRRKIAKKSRNNNNNNVIRRNFLSRPNPSLPKTSAVNSPFSSSQSSTTKSLLPKRPKGSKRRGREGLAASKCAGLRGYVGAADQEYLCQHGLWQG